MQKSVTLWESSLLLDINQHQSSHEEIVTLQDFSKTMGPFNMTGKSVSINEAKTRRSRAEKRRFFSFGDLVNFIHLSFYATNTENLRPYPAAGAIYSVQFYLIAYDIHDLPSGVYYLRWSDKQLELVNSEDQAISFRHSHIFQNNKERFSAIALMVIDTQLSSSKYHDRAWRFGLIEAGALLQTMYLAAEKLELATCALGAIADRPALQLCGLTPHQSRIFACGLGLS